MAFRTDDILYREFLDVWPIERLRNMTLAEYTESGSKDCFVYWLEFRLGEYGSIAGGSAFKFWIFSRKDRTLKGGDDALMYTDDYAWYRRLGDAPESAFEELRKLVVAVAEAARDGRVEEIDKNPLGRAFKWKIAFHYQDLAKPLIISVFMRKPLLHALGLDSSDKKTPQSVMYRALAKQRLEDESIFAFSERIWREWIFSVPCVVKLSKGAIENGYISLNLTSAPFPESMHGGSTDAESGESAHFRTDTGMEFDSDIRAMSDSSGRIRHRLGSYFKKIGAKSGDELFITLENEGQYLISTSKGDLPPPSPHVTPPAPDKKVIYPSVAHSPPLNQILFGPPGTGKTYHLQKLLSSKYTEAATSIDPDDWRTSQIASRISELTWWEALGAALYELGGSATVPQLSKHPYIVAVSSKKGRSKGVSQTLWATLQHHALEESKTVNITLKLAPFIFDKSADSVWELAGSWKEFLADVIEIVDEIKKGPKPTDEPVRRYEFVTFHQSFSYEDFMEGLTPVLDDETGNLRYDVRKGVFLRLCDRARADPTNKYAMIIDEINRANVSKVLGELITLIEIDKRAGAEHEISLTLPYSGERFSVPSNIDFIGTMNTADRSLTGLDIALRRRFSFVEMPPNPVLLSGVSVEGVDIKHMLERINERIEVLLDRDHQLGHAYFLPLENDSSIEKLSFIFRNQIVPLLQEYFFEDWQRIRWVLNDHRKGPGHRFVIEAGTSISALFGQLDELASDTKRWKLDLEAFNQIESYHGIADAGAA